MMASKSKQPVIPETDKFPRRAVELRISKDDSDEVAARKHAALAMSPELAAYRTINACETNSGLGEQIDVPALMDQLREQATAVNRGDLSHAEAMLMNQATGLQSLFARLIEKGMAQSHLLQYETHMRLALRAQNQCRATLETLATIKNPPIIYAKQANVTTGPQQINNGMVAPSQAREIKSEQTQLSGGVYELLPNTRASGAADGVNPALEAVGEIDRAKIPRG